MATNPPAAIPTPGGGGGGFTTWPEAGPPASGIWTTGQGVIDDMQQTWLCVSGGSPGTWVNVLTHTGVTASVTATNAPTMAEAVAPTVIATNSPAINAAETAFTNASDSPLLFNNFTPRTFKFGAPGSEVLYTVGAGDYRTIGGFMAGMLAAIGGSGTFGDSCGLSNNGSVLTATALATGSTYNGWRFLDTGGNQWLEYTGFANDQALEGGTDAGLTVVTGVNDIFKFGPPGSEDTYTVASGIYATVTDLATAMNDAEDTAHNPFSAQGCPIDGSGSSLVSTALVSGTFYNRWDFLAGATDFLADSGFTSGQALAGGIDGGLTVTAGVSDVFKFGAPGSEVVYTVAPGVYSTLIDIASAMASATDSHGNHWYSVGAMTNNGIKLVAHAPAEGPEYNGWDFLTGATDFLADSGFTNGQTLAGGA